jgi:hypothetical protein
MLPKRRRQFHAGARASRVIPSASRVTSGVHDPVRHVPSFKSIFRKELVSVSAQMFIRFRNLERSARIFILRLGRIRALRETAASSSQSKALGFLMADKSNDYMSAVNSVIGMCKDAQEGFRGLANAVKDAGGEQANSSGVLEALHHGWVMLKRALSGHGEHQILQETEPFRSPQFTCGYS